MSRQKSRERPLPGALPVRRKAVKGVHPVRPGGGTAGPRAAGSAGPVFVGPTPDGGDKEFVKIVAGKVGRRKPWFV
ncbi:MAG: hypothetical protein BAA02_10485 [Paenibacillaceae bacterium ZCTH02-B3]|nr:MAG: hypothetical protein BAA02_10485 [Paenibacillaceae bacterium ZCTH02-B3]